MEFLIIYYNLSCLMFHPLLHANNASHIPLYLSHLCKECLNFKKQNFKYQNSKMLKDLDVPVNFFRCDISTSSCL